MTLLVRAPGEHHDLPPSESDEDGRSNANPPAKQPTPSVSRLLSIGVLVVLLATALGAFFVTRNLVIDQEQRLLQEKADEVAALLANLFRVDPVELADSGNAWRIARPGSDAVVCRGRGMLPCGAAPSQSGWHLMAKTASVVVNAVGDGTAAGQPLSGDRAALAARALSVGRLVSALVVDQERNPPGIRRTRRLEPGGGISRVDNQPVHPGALYAGVAVPRATSRSLRLNPARPVPTGRDHGGRHGHGRSRPTGPVPGGRRQLASPHRLQWLR